MSVDGCLDAPGPRRLVLSGPEDLERVDSERAAADAIMVGAGTIRRDDPRLLVRSPRRQQDRAARGMPAHPARVTVTASGELSARARFFAPAAGHAPPAQAAPGRFPVRELAGSAAREMQAPGHGPPRYVYCPPRAAARLRASVGGLADVLEMPEPLRLEDVLADLAARGVRRLMVEGGARLGSRLLMAGLADELHVSVAPFFIGNPAAPRFAGPGRYPHGPADPMTLVEVRRLDDVVLLRYLLGQGDRGGQEKAGRHE